VFVSKNHKEPSNAHMQHQLTSPCASSVHQQLAPALQQSAPKKYKNHHTPMLHCSLLHHQLTSPCALSGHQQLAAALQRSAPEHQMVLSHTPMLPCSLLYQALTSLCASSGHQQVAAPLPQCVQSITKNHHIRPCCIAPSCINHSPVPLHQVAVSNLLQPFNILP
jgi:hypothetical protein